MKKFFLVMLMVAAQSLISQAQIPFGIGVRAGFNTSNITEERALSGSSSFHDAKWNQGFTVGAVIDIPISHRWSLQPGFFYDRRNADFASTTSYDAVTDEGTVTNSVYTEGSTSTNWLHVPILVSFKFFPIRSFGINLDFGPYVAWGVSGSNKYKKIQGDGNDFNHDIPEISTSSFKGDDALYFRTDWGFKVGGGLVLFRHYYVGAHYLFGMRNLAKNKQFVSKSHTREWQFTIGYNF